MHEAIANSWMQIIGLTLETRPDTVNADSIKLFRQYGYVTSFVSPLIDTRQAARDCKLVCNTLTTPFCPA